MFLNGALGGLRHACEKSTTFGLHLSHGTGESKRPNDWTQYIRKIEEKDGTICAFLCDV